MKRKKMITTLVELRRHATMENAHFDKQYPSDDKLNTDEKATNFIKQRTKLWRESYWIPKIEFLLSELEK